MCGKLTKNKAESEKDSLCRRKHTHRASSAINLWIRAGGHASKKIKGFSSNAPFVANQ